MVDLFFTLSKIGTNSNAMERVPAQPPTRFYGPHGPHNNAPQMTGSGGGGRWFQGSRAEQGPIRCAAGSVHSNLHARNRRGSSGGDVGIRFQSNSRPLMNGRNKFQPRGSNFVHDAACNRSSL